MAFGAAACSSGEGEGCVVDDFDGVAGGDYRFQLSVDDTAFSPVILKTQNQAKVTLDLTNSGTSAHGFSVRCLPTPNDDGCPSESCFPEASRIAPLEAGASATVEFEVPAPEGIYDFYSGEVDAVPTGQFVVQ